jgi:hypothetical protein
MNSDNSDDPGDDSQERFYMAPDHLGHWVVQDQSCRRSGKISAEIDARWN